MLRSVISSARGFATSQQPTQPPAQQPAQQPAQNPNRVIHGHTPNNLEKRFLVWNGKYKSIDEVPAHVSSEVMERCRNRMRIRMSNIMMALTVVGCCIMVYSGKKAARGGDSVVKQNIDWHQKYNEDQKKAASNK